ncbi:(R)-mandelonitrile lyase [Massilia litorea]|jgi:quercetin dioxygenase-like cupin family protein|uniref:Cupin domain-containing protein n=1 Tax=Massilia litorea TaxID=2769491 RepID=A0A7L9U3C1_9BURK|nr:cupin domain-containing protein [Massilia litorea]QOL48909.1 cupin domain-containing protein [Massilia litorea]
MKPAVLTTIALLAACAAHAQAPAGDIGISRAGTQAPVQGPAANFTGSVRVDPLFTPTEPARAGAAYVTFEPGARSAWHSHPLGQALVVTAGVGRVQRWGGKIEEIRPGDVIRIPPGVKHWHGAVPGTAMTHLAIQETAAGKNVEWMEKVSDEQYGE